jgi:predicted rRNA methylase YqxC with S4 and FtsJ domains
MIYKLYEDHNIKYLSLDDFDKIKDVKLTDDEFMYIKKLFRTVKEKPKKNTELKYLIIGCLNNLIGKLNIIKRTQIKNLNNLSVYNYAYSQKINDINKLHHKIIMKNKFEDHEKYI